MEKLKGVDCVGGRSECMDKVECYCWKVGIVDGKCFIW